MERKSFHVDLVMRGEMHGQRSLGTSWHRQAAPNQMRDAKHNRK